MSSTLLRYTSRALPRNSNIIRPLLVSQTKRTMSSPPPAGKSEWLVLVPDYEGVLEKRMEVRPYVLSFYF
jgi:hypothetical protein